MKVTILSLLFTFLLTSNAYSNSLNSLVTKAHSLVNSKSSDKEEMIEVFNDLVTELSDPSLSGVERERVLRAATKLKDQIWPKRDLATYAMSLALNEDASVDEINEVFGEVITALSDTSLTGEKRKKMLKAAKALKTRLN